jgi:hypothetical protein
MSETREWADAIGLDVRGKPDWIVGFAIETSGNLPQRQASGYTTRFDLLVSRNVWSVTVARRGQTFTYVWRPRGRAYLDPPHLCTLALTPPKKLATIGRWLTTVEHKLGTKFRRDRPTIHSNVKGGARALARWCSLAMMDVRRMPV